MNTIGSKKPMINTKGLKLPQKRSLILPRKSEDLTAKWFYIDTEGKECGPFSVGAIRKLIKPNTYVWREGLSEWVYAAETGLLKPVESKMSGVASNQTNEKPLTDKWAWMLATVPFIASWIMVYFLDGAGCSTDELYSGSFLTWIVMSAIFVFFDMRAIEESGRECPPSFLGFVLVPVYLFMRAAKDTKQYAPAILWCFMCAYDIYYTDQAVTRSSFRGLRQSVDELLVNGSESANYETSSPKEQTGLPNVVNSVAGRSNPQIALPIFCAKLNDRFDSLTEVQKVELEKIESGRPVVFCGEVKDVSEEEAYSDGIYSYVSVKVKMHKGSAFENLVWDFTWLGDGVIEVLVLGSGQQEALKLGKGSHVHISGEVYFHEGIAGRLRIKPRIIKVVEECDDELK